MVRIGYARISTIDQDLQVQLDRLRHEGYEIIRSEKVSGASREDPSCNINRFMPRAVYAFWKSDWLNGSHRGSFPYVFLYQIKGSIQSFKNRRGKKTA